MQDAHAHDQQEGSPAGEDDDDDDDEENTSSTPAPQTLWQFPVQTVNVLPREVPEPEIPGPMAPFLQKAWHKLAEYHKRGHIPAGDQPFKMPPGPLFRLPLPVKRKILIENFFQCWDGLFYFLHRPTVSEWIEIVTKNKNEGMPLSDDCSNSVAAIVLMVLAFGGLHPEKLTRQRKHDAHAWVHDLAATDEYLTKSIALTDADKEPTRLESVQARLLQDMYLVSTCRMNQAWQTFGNTLQLVTMLGLHRKTRRNRIIPLAPGAKPDYVKEQCERRTFWTVYNLDKYLSMIYGRPSHINDDDIDQILPDAINDEDITPDGLIKTTRADCTLLFINSQTK